MALALTKTDIQVYRQISSKKLDSVLNHHIMDAKFIDLQRLLGVELYEEIERDTVSHIALIDGGEYSYLGKDYTNKGLKAVWAHFAYARYIRFGSATDTPYNIVEKKNKDSESLSTQEKQVIYTENKKIATAYWDNVRKYLERTDYALFEICNSVQQSSGFSITTYGKN